MLMITRNRAHIKRSQDDQVKLITVGLVPRIGSSDGLWMKD